MDDLQAADLKSILHSTRATIYYLRYCQVLVNGRRVEALDFMRKTLPDIANQLGSHAA